MLLDVAVAVLFRVKFWRVGWQPFDDDVWMFSQVGGRLFAGMDIGSIPDQDKLAGNMSLQMFQHFYHIVTVHRAIEMAFVDFARQRQPNGGRDGASLFGHSPQDRAFTFGGPGTPQRLPERKTEFIKKHNICAVAPRLFLSWANRVPARLVSVRRRAQSHEAMAVGDSGPTDARDD